MKLLIHSNAPWVPSGYGTQTMQLCERLKADHDIAVSAYYGLQGSTLEWDGITVYPAGTSTFGNDIIRPHSEHHFDGERGLILTLLDVWVLKGKDYRGLPLASWVPLDHLKLQPIVHDFFVESEAIPIAMSRFGQKQLQDAGLKAFYVPHGIDTEVFTPLDRAECRERLNFPDDAFIVGMVAANQGQPSRKSFAEAFSAMARFMKAHDDVIFYLHTDTSGRRGGGVNLVQLANQCGIDKERIRECDQYRYYTGMLSPESLARAYNCLDVLLNPSAGEGFGIPDHRESGLWHSCHLHQCNSDARTYRRGMAGRGARVLHRVGQLADDPRCERDSGIVV